MPKQFQFNENSSHTNRIQQYNLIMSNEETKQLAGLVAKTRALFENNNSTKRFIQEEQPKRTNYRVQQKQLISENDSDKENSTTTTNKTETVAPFLNQLKPSSKLATKFQTIFNSTSNTQVSNLPEINKQQPIKNHNWNQYKSTSPPLYSSSSASSASSSPPPSSLSYHSFESNNDPIIPTSNLWQQSEQCRKEFNLPISVRQAKMCFERNIQEKSSVRSTPIQQIKSKPFVQTVLPQGESPIFSSSSSSSTSSVPSSPTSSLDSTNRFKLIDQNKSAFNFKQSIHLPNLPQQSQLTPNNKIKILKKNFTKNVTPNEEVKDELKYLQKTSKYLQLYNDNTAISTTTTASQMHETDSENTKYPTTATSTASIQIKTIKLKQQEPVVSIKSILRNKTPADCVVPQHQQQQIVSPLLNERYVNQFIEKVEPELNCAVKVDQSSCVLPSKLKNKNINEDIKHQPPEQQQTVVKSNNFKQWQQPKVVSNVGFVKNHINSTNLANNNNSGSNTTNVTKR